MGKRLMLTRTLPIAIIFALILGSASSASATYQQIYTPLDTIEHTELGPAFPAGEAPRPLTTRSVGDILYEREFRRQNSTYRYLATDQGNYMAYKQFVKYLTKSWLQNEQYTIEETYTVSAQIQSDIVAEVTDGITLSIGASMTSETSTTIGATIPADKNRFSKLALCADFFVQEFRYQYFMDDITIVDSPNCRNMYPVNSYIIVAYQ